MAKAKYYIELSKAGIKGFQAIEEIIKEKDFDKWHQLLKQKNDPTTYLLSESKFNILNASILTGWVKEGKFDDPISKHAYGLLQKLEMYLQGFPALKKSKAFRGKVKMLDGINFLATLSELSLAYKFQEFGYKVHFETKFKELSNNGNRDIDITIFKNPNSQIHVEVYTPHQLADVQGFLEPTEEDDSFQYKIESKLTDKFGTDGIQGLQGTVLLAVNTIFLDMLQLKTALGISNENIFLQILKKQPASVNGLLIFTDQFGSDNSFRFDKMYLKQ